MEMNKNEVSSKYENISGYKRSHFLLVKLLNEAVEQLLMNNGGNKRLQLNGKQRPLCCFSLVSDVTSGFRSVASVGDGDARVYSFSRVICVFSCLFFLSFFLFLDFHLSI
jgi:hypothetical protein